MTISHPDMLITLIICYYKYFCVCASSDSIFLDIGFPFMTGYCGNVDGNEKYIDFP